jgi:hypothetical protein
MNNVCAALVAIASTLCAAAAWAAAQCEGPTSDGTVWNLVCAADPSQEAGDDYQCDYIISVSTADGMTEEQEATGSLSPGQSSIVIWSTADYGGDSHVTGATIVRGSCSR